MSQQDFHNFLLWAKESGVELDWMGVPIDAAIWIIEQEPDDVSAVQPIFDIDIEDPEHAILVMMKLGIAAEKKTLAHQLPPSGRAIYSALVDLKDGIVREGPEAAVYTKWECWNEDFTERFRVCNSLPEFQEIVFGAEGLVAKEIELIDDLDSKGFTLSHDERTKATHLLARWNSLAAARASLMLVA